MADPKEVHDDIWLVSFMDYDLGYFDLETRVLEPLENPFRSKSVTHVAGTFCHPCLRAGPRLSGGERGIRTPDTVSRIPVFKTGAFNLSAISPRLLQFYYTSQFLQF